VETPVHPVESYELTTPSTLPVGDSTDFGKDYSQPEFFVDLCFNVLVRPTRISPRQSGAAGPRSTLRGCAARPGTSVTYCSPAAPTGPSPWVCRGVFIIAS
jgi:hypothetical protein